MRAHVPGLSVECSGTSQSAPVTDATSDERSGVIRPSQALRDPSRLPPAAIFACFILAGALVALDLVISSHYGLLARSTDARCGELYGRRQDAVLHT